MKKSIIYLGLALVAFANASFASQNVSPKNKMEYIFNSNTPLCLAIVKGDLETVKKFIEYGTDVNQTSNGMTPLMFAARYNKVEILKILITNGAKVDTKDSRGFTALKYAMISNAADAASYLEKI
jgi:ankyrin repeat protein